MAGYRKIMAAVFLIFFLSPVLAPGAAAGAGGKTDLVLAYSLQGLADVDARDATAALRIYTAELARSVGYTADCYVYDDLETVIAEMQRGKVDLLGLSSMDYLRIKARADLELALGYVKGGKKSLKYLLLTHQNRGYANLGDLKNRKLLMAKEDDTARVYLQTLLFRQKFGESRAFFSSVEEKSKTSQVVLPVFFGQADACITTDVAFRTMVEMNPQLGRDLKIMASSPELIPFITVFRKTLANDVKETTLTVGKSLRSTVRGRQVLMLFKIENFVQVAESDLESIKSLMGEYHQLRSGKK